MWISLSFNFMAMILQELLVLTQPILLNEKNLKYILFCFASSEGLVPPGVFYVGWNILWLQVSPKAAAPVQQLEILSRFQVDCSSAKKTWSKKRKG